MSLSTIAALERENQELRQGHEEQVRRNAELRATVQALERELASPRDINSHPYVLKLRRRNVWLEEQLAKMQVSLENAELRAENAALRAASPNRASNSGK